MPSRKRVLFVDDEPSIRLTLPPVLEQHGFDVTSAGSVADALLEINTSRFDVLLSDLNIGEEGDGFLVVSAMRHIQPRCVTVILTGYPAFETALQAIRNQVDDYLVKPADVEALVNTLREKLSDDNTQCSGPKRLAALLRQKQSQAIQQAQEMLRRDPEFSRARLDNESLLGRLEDIFASLTSLLEGNAENMGAKDIQLAADHGLLRRRQGFGSSAIARDFEILETLVYDLVESNLIELDPGGLILDLRRAQLALSRLMRQALAARDGSSSENTFKRNTA